MPADRVQRADELDAALYSGVGRVGVTAGTSAPDDAIDAVLTRLREIARSPAAHAVAESLAETATLASPGRSVA